MARGAADELLLAGPLPLHGNPKAHGRHRGEVLGEHLLLAAEAAADASGEDVELVRAHPEDVGELLHRDEGGLRRGADLHDA